MSSPASPPPAAAAPAAASARGRRDRLYRTWTQSWLRGRFTLEFVGEDLWSAPKRAVMVCNSVGEHDLTLLATALPDDHVIIIAKERAATPDARRAMRLGRVEVIDLDAAGSIKGLVRLVQGGARLVTLPEGRPSRSPAVAKLQGWPATVADMAEAVIVPLRLVGAERIKGAADDGYTKRFMTPVRVKVLPPRQLPLEAGLRGAARREALQRALYDIMRDAAFDVSPVADTLFSALIAAADRVGPNKTALVDPDRAPISFRRLITGAFALGAKLAAMTEPGERVGVLLPNSVGGVVVFFALIAYGRVPAMLNFSAGPAALTAAVETGPLRIVLSSRRFVELGKLEASIEAMASKARIVWLDDVRTSISGLDRITALARAYRAQATHEQLVPNRKATGPAVVLFTSGSEGVPKGVVLSHANLQANAAQILTIADFSPANIVFNPLPIFHSFGLTAGTLMPLIGGMQVVMYPSPLHYKQIPDFIQETGATILFGTDTFLSGYGRNAHTFDFRTIHSVIAGGERVKPETRAVWIERFGIRLFEGYGATECAPVLACNTPMQSKPGTVGRLFTHVEHRIDPVPGIEKGGRLVVAGPNVMIGYLRHEQPGQLQPLADRWYDTGDIVDVDAEGYVTILGRAKRFAKLGGEMVSLVAAELQVAAVWPDHQHAIVAIPDARKGEALVLVTTMPDADLKTMLAAGRASGIPELLLPRTIVKVDAMPVLGSGKTDYVSVQKIALARAVETMDETA